MAKHEEFSATERMTYLLTGSVGLMPRSVQEQAERNRARFYGEGPSSPGVRDWMEQSLQRVRTQLAGVLGGEEEEIAFLPNVTSAFDLLALGLPWQDGDEILIPEWEHQAALMPFHRLEETTGVRIRRIPVGPETLWQVLPERILPLLTDRTRLVLLSHVAYATGNVAPVREIADLLRRHAPGVLLAVDGAQSVGAMPVSVRDLGCDLYAMAGYKWCLGPEGTGALHVRRPLLERIVPYRVGYYGVEGLDADGHYHFLPNARRYEGTTYNRLDFLTLGDSLSFLEHRGMEAVNTHIRHCMAAFRDVMKEIPGLSFMTNPDSRAGLLTFRLTGRSAPEIAKRLFQEHGVLLRNVPLPDGGALRASPHLYNTPEEGETLATALQALV